MLRTTYCAPKAGALPGCATPRHEVAFNYRALSRFLAAPITPLFGGASQRAIVQRVLGHDIQVRTNFTIPPKRHDLTGT